MSEVLPFLRALLMSEPEYDGRFPSLGPSLMRLSIYIFSRIVRLGLCARMLALRGNSRAF